MLYLILIIGITLLVINIYGLFRSIEPDKILPENIHFSTKASPITYEAALHGLIKVADDTNTSYAERANQVIANRMTHIHWFKYQNTKFNQLIPIWDNYFLFLVGKFTKIPEFQRYHFANYQKSLKRGIGVCGDKSIVLSQVLNKEGIKNEIISFRQHVLVEVVNSDGCVITYDPDFGVSLPISIKNTNSNKAIVRECYSAIGLSTRRINDLMSIYSKPYNVWRSTFHFMTKRLLFEQLTYFLKWPFPMLLIIAAVSLS